MSIRSLRRVISSSCVASINAVSSSKLYYLLQLCNKSKLQIQGKQVHQQIILRGSSKDPFMLTKLFQMYADNDDLVAVDNLFDELPHPNVYAWTAILAFYLRHRMYLDCLQIYIDVKSNAVLLDGYVFPKVLMACAKTGRLDIGVGVHKDVIVCGYELNLEVSNSLIEMYMKCRDVFSGRRVFNEKMERDLFSWNLMISGFVYNELLEEAVNHFYYMKLDGFAPDIVTLNTTVDAYCRKGLCDEAYEVFKQIREPNIISWTTLISGYSRIGKHEAALEIFRSMMSRGTVIPDVDSLSSILVSCRHLNDPLSGREVHGYGIKTHVGTSFYKSAGPAILTMYAKCARLRDSVNVFELMDKIDVISWNAMILGFSDLGLPKMAVECFRKLQRIGLKNDNTTISTLLPLCNLKFGKQVHAYIRKREFDSIPVLNALIHMYCKCGQIGYEHCIFLNMDDRDLVSWNTMIGGFGLHGFGQLALQLVYEMNHFGLSPNLSTFTSVLSACSHSGLLDEGINFFYSMSKDHGLRPNMEHFACVADMLARSGQLEDAVNVINKMPFVPDKRIWGALLAAARLHQNVDVGMLAAEQLIHLEPENARNYITLSNIYARAGRWDDALRIRKQMENMGSVKPSGQSWIEGGY